MAYKTCPDCGTKLGSFGCPNCNEHDYISMQDCYTPAPMHQSNHTPEQRGVEDNYRANFLWGFPDDSIEMIGYEFANGKTEEYLKECWTALLDKIKTHQSPLPSKGQEGEAEIIKGSDKDLAIEVVARFAAKSGGRNGRWKDQMKQQFIEGAIWMRERLTTPAP